MQQTQGLRLNIIRSDPYFGFPLDNNNYALDVYKSLHQKGYKCLSQYEGSINFMTVMCPNGHTWHGYPRKITIPCNNCQECWKSNGRSSVQKLEEIIRARKGRQLTAYMRNDVKIEVECDKGHKFSSCPRDIKNGT